MPTRFQDRDRRRLHRRVVLSILLLAFLLLAASAWVARKSIRIYLSSVTGEENLSEQVKGLGRLIILRLTQPPLQLAPDVPIAHAGVNPFGVNAFLEQEVEPQKLELAIRMIRDAGVHWVRQEFPWEDIEHSARGDFWDHKWSKSAWEKYDRIVDLANQYGLELIVRLGNPPTWARADGDALGTFAPPDDPEDFGSFVYAVVERYRGKVTYFQIWNEPNIHPEWGEQPVDAAGYVKLLQTAYRRAKQANPDCVIISAGLAQTIETGPKDLSDLVYLQQMYDAGVKGYFDIMGVMAYGLWTGPGDHRASPELTNFARPQLIRDIMVRNGDEDKALWATEIGWNAVPEDFSGFPTYGRVTLDQQARYAVQAYQRAQQEWPWMGVMNYWFFKRATDTESDQAFYYFRLVEPDFTPLPVYTALSAYANQPAAVYVGYHQETHWALHWEGTWESLHDTQAILSTMNRTAATGSSLTFDFVGTDLDLVVHRDPQSGDIQVRIDGKSLKPISLRSERSEYALRLPLARRLPNGRHTVEIITTNSSGSHVDIDGLVVQVRAAPWPLWGLACVLAVALALIVCSRRRSTRAGPTTP
jgi:hypothetical protein